MAKRPSAERRAMSPPVIGEKLALETRDVDADRAFGLAGATLEAEIEDLVDAAIAQAGFVEASGHRQTEHVGPAARRMFLFQGRPVRRTHRAIELLATGANAAAHRNRTM